MSEEEVGLARPYNLLEILVAADDYFFLVDILASYIDIMQLF